MKQEGSYNSFPFNPSIYFMASCIWY